MEIIKVGVIGVGTMGAGIAQVAAVGGCSVELLDRDKSTVRTAIEGLRGRLGRMAQRGKITAAEAEAAGARLLVATGYECLADCDLVIEAVFEDMAVKHASLKAAEAVVGEQALFATNTSSLSVGEIAACLKRPERVAGMHFFNPAPVMPLVEVVAADCSAAETVEMIYNTARAWGKVAVKARDVPGFIVNRVARPFYLEGLRLLGDGVAGVAEIDAAMRALGFRMGPFQLMDLVGIDINYAVSCSVYARLGEPPRLRPHDLQRLAVESGTLGRKTKSGFYDYSSDPPRPIAVSVEPRDAARIALEPLAACDEAGVACGQIQRQILFGIFNEAAHALDDAVASAADIDLAMRKGTNYPQGPIAWSESMGRAVVREGLNLLNERLAGRFEPAAYWQ